MTIGPLAATGAAPTAVGPMGPVSLLLLLACVALPAPSHGADLPFWRQLLEQRLEKFRAGGTDAPLLHRRQVQSLGYAIYREPRGGAGVEVPLPAGEELAAYRRLAARSDSEAFAYLDELYGRRDDLKALGLRDTDGDGVPDYRVSDYFGKFMEGDLDLDGDGVLNVYDAFPHDRTRGGRDTDGDGVPDVEGTYVDVNGNGLPDHLDWSLHKDDLTMAEIQLRLFRRHRIILVERDAAFDRKLAVAVDDAVARVLAAYFDRSPVLPTLRTVAVERTALLGKLLAAVAEDNTSAQVFSQSRSLTVYDEGRTARHDIALLGLVVHELGHSYHMSLDFDTARPLLENGRTAFPAPRFVELVAGFGWRVRGRYDGRFGDTGGIVPRFAYTGMAEPLFTFKGKTPAQWDAWLWETYDALGQVPDYLERPEFARHAIVSDYALTSPYEWYGDNLLAYLLVTIERALGAQLEREGRGGEIEAAAERITAALREIWPGFHHRNIAPEALAYFRDLFPLAEADGLDLARRYLLPLL